MKRRPPIRTRALVGLVLASGVASAQAGPEPDELVELALLCSEGHGAQQLRACDRLEDLGPDTAPGLLTFLGNRPHARRDDAARQVLARWTLDDVIQAVLEAPDAGTSLAARMRTIRRLGELGSAEALDELFDVAGLLSTRHRQHPTVQRELQESLTDLLTADPAGLARLSAVVADLDPPLLGAVALAVRDVRGRRTLDVLVRLLGRDDELDRVVVECIGHLPPWNAEVASGSCGRTLSAYLSASDPHTRRAAAIALGRLGDTAYVEELMRLLSDADARPRLGAEWALQRISGRRWENDAERWQAWWSDERDWLRSRSRPLLRDALDADAGTAFAAIRELAEHPVFATALADDLGEAVHHDDEGVARAACTALSRLRGSAVFAPLVDALSDRRDAVRQAADHALRTLTEGAPLLSTPESWEAWLQG